MQDYEKSRRFLNEAERRPIFHEFKIRWNVKIARKTIEQFRDRKHLRIHERNLNLVYFISI